MTTTAVLASAILAIDLEKYKNVAFEYLAATGSDSARCRQLDAAFVAVMATGTPIP